MDNSAKNYKSLYEASLLTISKKEELLAEKDEKIALLHFELDKFRKYLFGQKNEKLPASSTDVNQMGLFELGTTQPQQEELCQ
ncbi:MAG: transposase, partial [Bacteroidota bacterium]